MTDARKLMAVPLPAIAPTPDRTRVGLALLATYLIWGSTYLAVRIAVETIPPFMMTASRFLVAGTILFVVLRARGAALPTRRQWRNAALVGALMMGGGMGMVAYAEQTVASGLAALAVAGSPLWVTIFAGFFGQRSTRQEWLGLIIGLAGIVLLNLEGDLRGNPLSAALLIAASLAWSLGSILSKRLDMPSGLMTSATQMLSGGVVLTGFSALTHEQLTAAPSAPSLLAWAYLIGFGSLVAYSAYLWLLRNVRPTLATSYAYVNPAVAMLLGITLAGEAVGIAGLLALPVILVGVGLIAFLRKPTNGAH